MVGFALVLALTLLQPASGQDNELMKANNARVEQWVARQVADGRRPSVVPIACPSLARLMPKVTFHFAHYREYPVALAPSDPFATRNVVMVDKAGVCHLFASRDAFRKAFIVGRVQTGSPRECEELALGYLAVSAHFSQDGFFKFLVSPSNVKSDPTDSWRVTGSVPVEEKGGDTGKLAGKFLFQDDQPGHKALKAVEEKDTIKPGVRPICQCTLLLDPNPIVRKMAERDLLVMGPAAFPYMKEQLALASKPLRAEILRVWRRIERGER